MQPKKTPEQIEAMREGGKILAHIFDDIRGYVHAGLTGLEVDEFVGQKIAEYGAQPTYKTPEVNFPGNICISTNEQIVHGIPTDAVFERGDLVSFDLVITYKGMKTDSAFTMIIDEQPKGALKLLMSTTERSLYAGIDAIKGAGAMTGDVSASIQQVLEGAHLGIVRDLVGHGVGQEMHMAPEIPNYGVLGKGTMLHAGDTIAIEPMATLGGEKIISEDDGWTISTHDGSMSAHFEHTVLITQNGAEILTLRD